MLTDDGVRMYRLDDSGINLLYERLDAYDDADFYKSQTGDVFLITEVNFNTDMTPVSTVYTAYGQPIVTVANTPRFVSDERVSRTYIPIPSKQLLLGREFTGDMYPALKMIALRGYDDLPLVDIQGGDAEAFQYLKALSDNGEYLFFNKSSNLVRLDTEFLLESWQIEVESISHLRASYDGNAVIVSTGTGAFMARDGAILGEPVDVAPDFMAGVEISPSGEWGVGKQMGTQRDYHTVHMWRNGKAVGAITPPGDNVGVVDISDDGLVLIAGLDESDYLYVWLVDSNQELLEKIIAPYPEYGFVAEAKFTHEGDRFVMTAPESTTMYRIVGSDTNWVDTAD